MKNLLKTAITLTAIGVAVKVVKNSKIAKEEKVIPIDNHIRAEKLFNQSLKTFSKQRE